METESAKIALTILKKIGLSLSRLLSYAFGGFLAVVVLYIFESVRASQLFKESPGVSLLASVVVGAGIYRAHRSAVIPIHHWIGCFLFWLWDKINGTEAGKSVSPTRWFRALGVRRFRKILAYNILRHDPTFMKRKERDDLDLKHAEFGLVVMGAEGCFAAGLASLYSHNLSWHLWLAACLVLVVASYPAPLQQHATECLRWQVRENEDKSVSKTLAKYGLLE